MQRRTLLASASVAAALAASGCGVRLDSPTIKGSPAAPYTPPPPTPYPGAAQVAALEAAAEAALRTVAVTPGGDAASAAALAGIRVAHIAVLDTPDPFWRRGTPSAPPASAASPAPAPSRDAALATAATTLTALRDATVARAVAEPGLAAAFWAALAASAEQARLWLATPVGAITRAVPGRVVLVQDDIAGFTLLVERYHQAVYGFSSLLGFLPNGHPLRPLFVAQLTTVRTRRDALVAYDRAASATPTPGAGAYSVPPLPPDRVVAEAGALLTAVATAAGVWVASASDARRARAVQELLYAAGAGLPLGTGLAEWPGWPD